MKKILLMTFIAMFALCVTTAAAESIKFQWEDDNQKSTGYGWKLFQRVAGQTFDYNSPIATIMWAANETQHGISKEITLTGQGGETITCEFVLRAFDAKGNESADSNIVSKDITLPLNPPYELLIDLSIVTP